MQKLLHYTIFDDNQGSDQGKCYNFALRKKESYMSGKNGGERQRPRLNGALFGGDRAHTAAEPAFTKPLPELLDRTESIQAALSAFSQHPTTFSRELAQQLQNLQVQEKAVQEVLRRNQKLLIEHFRLPAETKKILTDPYYTGIGRFLALLKQHQWNIGQVIRQNSAANPQIQEKARTNYNQGKTKLEELKRSQELMQIGTIRLN